jgi:hypothetical protein
MIRAISHNVVGVSILCADCIRESVSREVGTERSQIGFASKKAWDGAH